MRTFISLEIPPEIKKEVSKIQQRLKQLNIKGRWVKEKNLHLTLVFLGEIEPQKIKKVEKILEKIIPETTSFQLSFEKVDCFPSPFRPKIIYLYLKDETSALKKLTEKIRQELKEEKVWFDKKSFVPHLTLGRLQGRRNLKKVVQNLKPPPIAFKAKKVHLVKSALTPRGPIYKNLQTEILKIN